MCGPEYEQIRDTAQGFDTAVGRAIGQRLFELADDRILLTHRAVPFRLEGDVDADLGKNFRR